MNKKEIQSRIFAATKNLDRLTKLLHIENVLEIACNKHNIKECIEFPGLKSDFGYGRLIKNRKLWLAHRYVFYIIYGFHPETILHLCDNPPCININHLKNGTMAENNLDCLQKGRRNIKLSKKDIEYIKNSVMSAISLSKKFNVSRQYITTIKKS